MFASLCCQHSFCFITVAFTFPILLIGVLHGDLLVHKILAVHVGYGRV